MGSYQPNAWGLYDIHGNVMEWCLDWYGTYPAGPVVDPVGASSGSDRAIHGGGWDFYAYTCRVASRSINGLRPAFEYEMIGLRVALPAGQ